MKNNTNEAKEHLAKAISSLPQDFTLKKAKYYVHQALNEIQKVEGKRAKRESSRVAQEELNAKREDMQNAGMFDNHLMWQMMNPETANKAIGNLEKMIKAEKVKLEKKKQATENLENLFG